MRKNEKIVDFVYLDAKIIPGKIAVLIEDLTEEEYQNVIEESIRRVRSRNANLQETGDAGTGLGSNSTVK